MNYCIQDLICEFMSKTNDNKLPLINICEVTYVTNVKPINECSTNNLSSIIFAIHSNLSELRIFTFSIYGKKYKRTRKQYNKNWKAIQNLLYILLSKIFWVLIWYLLSVIHPFVSAVFIFIKYIWLLPLWTNTAYPYTCFILMFILILIPKPI